MEHQRKAINFINDKDYWALFFDFGTGKSLIALKYIDNHPEIVKTLIICPKILVLTSWPEEIKKHTNLKYIVLVGSREEKLNKLAGIGGKCIWIINYEGIKNIFEELCNFDFNFILADESTKIKSPKTAVTKFTVALGKYTKRRAIMTGFPVTENILNLYTQIKFMDQGQALGTSYWKFVKEYFKKGYFKYNLKEGALKEIREKLKDRCIGVRKEDCIDLPDKQYLYKNVDPTDEQKQLLQNLKNNFSVKLKEVEYSTIYVLPVFVKMQEICSGFLVDSEGKIAEVKTPKDDLILELIEEISPHKTIIWCKYKFEQEKLSKLLSNYELVVLKSDLKKEEIQSSLNKFRKSKDCNILITNSKFMGTGITLVEANYAIYYSNDWSYEIRANSEARIFRKGSADLHKKVTFIDLYLNKTIDERISKLLKKKGDIVEQLKRELIKEIF